MKEIKEEQRRAQLEARLADELKLSKLNELKLIEKWRQIMRIAKTEELRKEIEALSEIHERRTARTNLIISRLQQNLLEEDAFYEEALKSHLQHIDSLIDLHNSNVETLHNEFLRDLNLLQQEFQNHRNEITQKYKVEKEEILDILEAMEAEFREAENEMRQEFHNMKDELKNKNAEQFSYVQAKLNQRIQQLEAEFETANQTYTTTTEQLITKLKQDTARDDSQTKTLEINNRKLKRLQKNLNHWRTKMTNNVRECESRNRALKEEKDTIASHFHQLKAKMTKFREGQDAKLVELTTISNNCIKELQKKLKTAEKILTLAEMNNKLKTEREKLAVREEMTEEGLDAVELKPFNTIAVEPNGKEVEKWEYLNNFFQKYNKALLDKHALENEREELLRENRDLQAILKEYLNGISVNSNSLNAPNSLFIVNGSISDTIKISTRPSPNDLHEQQIVVMAQSTI